MNIRSWSLASWLGAAVCIVGAAACGDGDDDSGAQPLRLETYEQPVLVAFRDEATLEWTALPVGTSSSYELLVSGSYELAIGCEGPDERPRFDLTVYGRTPEDGAALEHRCTRRTRPYWLRANVLQPGALTFDGRSRSESHSPWKFDVSAAAGSFALIMQRQAFPAETQHIGIRRNIEIRGDTDLGTINLSQEAAFEMQPQAIVLANQLPEERSSSSVSLLAGGTRVWLVPPGQVGPVLVAPDALLLPADQQILTVSTTLPPDSTPLRRGRSVSRELRAGPPVVTMLPEPLESVAMESTQHRTMMVWERLPPHDVATLSSSSVGNALLPSRVHRLVVSRAFLERVGAHGLTLDVRGIPGMKSEWLHDPALDLSENFAITSTADGVDRGSGVNKFTRASRETAASMTSTEGTADRILPQEGEAPLHIKHLGLTVGAP